MKKLFIAIIISISAQLFAAPGDTTWIQANIVHLNNYNNFDTAVSFPNGSKTYRKILMVFTLGEYYCPSGTQYCHQWDYTVTNYVLTHTDTVELSRFITPYANTGVPRFPNTWKQRYIYDVSDFYTLLKDSAKIRIFYSGYSGGFTANVRFAFIEGTPVRNVLGVDPLWTGAFTYGNTADPIANHLPAKTFTAPVGTSAADMKFTVTGHGSDATSQCCEFSSHNYSVLLNNGIIAQKAIWRDDCGFNQLYAQGGTWIYNRGNWCPGDAVNINTHTLPAISSGSTYSLGVQFAPYVGSGSYGDYALEGHVFYYGNYNHTVDASLNDIISPSNFEDHYRENPSGNQPVVRVRNTGSSTINSITFSYNVKDSAATTYTWNGTLLSQQDTNITLAALNTLTNLSLAGYSLTTIFTTKITAVNGAIDGDTTNNKFQSSFVSAPSWPTSFLVYMNTNSAGINGVGSGDQSETTWQITDMNGNVMASRLIDSTNMSYIDTVTLPNHGFYKLQISDVGCDGLHWWVWDQNPNYGINAGSFFIRKLSSGLPISMKGYVYSGTYAHDFGCGYSAYFTTGGALTGIENVKAKDAASIMAYPNPAQDQVNITLNGVDNANGLFNLIDGQGRIVLQQKASGVDNNINTANLNNGIYTIIYRDAKTPQMQTRMLIVR